MGRKFATHVLLPTLIGAATYLLFRTPSLLAFRWVETVGLSDQLMAIRGHVSSVRLPNWFLYSLPDGIWVYATTSWMAIIWQGKKSWAWITIAVLLAVGSEIGQAFGIVPGTYQHLDVLFYVGAFVLALLQVRWLNETPGSVGDCLSDNGCARLR